MQPVSSLAPARVVVGATMCRTRATATATTSCAWPRRVVAPAPRPRLRLRARAARCGGGRTTGPVEARDNVVEAEPVAVGQVEAAVLAAEELEVLEEAAIAGADEGRRPTDYGRRAHIFEESSRVFRDLKHRHDGDGETGAGHGGAAEAATEAETGTRQQQQQQQQLG